MRADQPRARITRPAAVLMLLALAGTAGAVSIPISSNSSANPTIPALATSLISASGVAAPAGAQWCEVPSDAGGANAIAGFACHLLSPAGPYRFADDFTVTDAVGWRIDSVVLFVYQPGWTAGGAPVTGVNLRIWNGQPGAVGATVVWGNDSTNRLSAVTPTTIQRIFSSTAAPSPAAPSSSRPIFRVDAAVGVTLPPGAYWLDWQFTATDPAGEVYSPSVTIAGVRTQPSWNARQLKSAGGGQWSPLIDPGKPSTAPDVAQDLPFILIGERLTPPPCSGDANGDGQVNGADLSVVLANWNTSVAPGLNGDLNNDGQVNNADLSVLLSRWNQAC